MTHDLTVPADQLVQDVRSSRVYDVARVTPLENAPLLSRRLGNSIMLKREDLQPVFSFKLRGAYNRMAHLSAEERAQGVIAASAGNHGQGGRLLRPASRHQSCHRNAQDHSSNQGRCGQGPGR